MALNLISTWRQGTFIDHPRYARMCDDWKNDRRREESHLVRPGPTENAICKTETPENATWIAQRLNLASKLEQLSYDFATGKNDGQELVDYVRANLES